MQTLDWYCSERPRTPLEEEWRGLLPRELVWNISYLAETLLGSTRTPRTPVDPFFFSAACGHEVSEGRLESGMGLALPGAGRGRLFGGRIVVDSSRSRLVQRVICAHEAAHHLLFFPDWFEEGHGRLSLSRGDVFAEEEACDVFALALLVPLNVLEKFGRVRTAVDVSSLADEYEVPAWALLIRLAQLRSNFSNVAFMVLKSGLHDPNDPLSGSSDVAFHVITSSCPPVIRPGEEVQFSFQPPTAGPAGHSGLAWSRPGHDGHFTCDATVAPQQPDTFIILSRTDPI